MFKRIILSSGIILCIFCCIGLSKLLPSTFSLPVLKYFFAPALLLTGFIFFKIRIRKPSFYRRWANLKQSMQTTNPGEPLCENGAIQDLLGRDRISVANSGVSDLLCNKRILITGAAGSIGSGLAKQVAALRPALLIICDQNETGLYELEYQLQQQFNPGSLLKVFVANITNHAAVTEIFTNWKPDIVFHAAAYKHVPMMELHPCEAIYNNVYGTKVLADLAELFEVDRFIFISTDKAVNPSSIMGASKRIAGNVLQRVTIQRRNTGTQ